MSIKLAFSLSVILSVKLSMVRAEVVDRELEALLKQQVAINEGVQIRQFMPVELDDSISGVEKAVLWTILGPTYWRNQLSILANQSGQLRLLATIPLMGMAIGFGPVKPDGTLQVATKISDPNDPLCCPTQVKRLYFRYRAGRLLAVESDPE
ncbi:hypothetical protein [Methylomonas methanica]|uniref:Uncharacterized protein n=1 Tax=Methylomonas methanica (strain DSM 25384 / MC09) TaxID=857087 RepID=G0A5Z5_METMM|nr:hypothetical protein [Methylomonas methanica]AEG00445.1 hypothetical protein Metme_2037 [Methylomonas methanica MC09]